MDRIRGTLYLFFTVLSVGCANMQKSLFPIEDRPEGFPRPSDAVLVSVQGLIEDGKFGEAISSLTHYKAKTHQETHWKDYLLGISHFGEKNLEKGIVPLKRCYEAIKRDLNATSEDFRISGMCLKKIGWSYRSKKEYLIAYAYHNLRYHYVVAHGSSHEVHDALISLDVDAYLLEDLQLSVKILKESILYGEAIEEPKNRFMALGTTYNNLAGSLYGLKRFSESESSIKLALDYWEKYEQIVGTSEFKVVWAHYGIGDVYEQWTKYLKENHQNYSRNRELSLAAYRTSLRLGETRNLPSSDQDHIKERIKVVEGM